jgi:cysteine desulfurase/selenocysteine lyase
MIAAQTGAKISYLNVDADGRVARSVIERRISPGTKVVAFTHISNVWGTVLPVERIVAAARAVGAVTVLDCAQSVAHMPVDLPKLDIDFAAFSGHKMYGPMGIGVLYARRGLLDEIEPLFTGGEMIDQVYENASTFKSGVRKLEAGTPNVSGAVGLAKAVQFIEQVGFAAIEEHERELTLHLLQVLRGLSTSVRIYGNPCVCDDRAGVVAFNIPGSHPVDIAQTLDQHNIAIRAGTHCAQPLLRRMGVEATCRVSPCFYNTHEEIDRLGAALQSSPRSINSRLMTFTV